MCEKLTKMNNLNKGISMEDHISLRADRNLLPVRLLSGLFGMWSSMKIPLSSIGVSQKWIKI